MRSRFTNGNRSPSCLRHSCSILLTESFRSPSLSRVLSYVTSFTIRSSAIPRKSLTVLRAVPASLYALFRLHFFSFIMESTAAYRRWISVRSFRSTFAALSRFVGRRVGRVSVVCRPTRWPTCWPTRWWDRILKFYPVS